MNNDSFYQEDILEMYKNPAHKGNLNTPDVSIVKENTMCGDTITLDLDVDKATNVIKDAKFNGESCLVSVVSAEVFLDEIIGKTVKEALAINKENLLDMLKLNLTTSRIKCATLILHAFEDAVNKLNLGSK